MLSYFPQSAKEFLDGQIFLFDKPFGWTSFDLVKKIRSLIKQKYGLKKIKVGHAGTLDPLATGLLIICTGKFTKQICAIQEQYKVYVGEITLGGSTPSYDLETAINKKYNTHHISKEMIQKKILKFSGEIEQTPPIFSALKKDGERLYKKARRGEHINIKPRKVTVYYFKATAIKIPKIKFKIMCSKGTYIRSLAHDLGLELKSGAHLSKLCRISIGEHKLTHAINIVEFEKKLNKTIT